MFRNRVDAGEQLAVALAGRVPADALVLGVPRGGVVVAAQVARALGLELDLEVVRKIGAPGNPEYAVGAVDAEGRVIEGGAGPVDPEYLRRAAEVGRAEITRRLTVYRGERPAPRVAGRTVLLVDDGIATGLTLAAAVVSLRGRGAARIIVTVPASTTAAEEQMRRIADELVVLDSRPDASAVGQFYADFSQTTDAEVIGLLAEAWAQR